jgi:4-hydroxy-2-oxoheptanedioate aldolase
MNGIGINEVKENPVRYHLHHDMPSVGTWLSLCSPVSAEMMARVGWEWLVVDIQHSPVDFGTVVNCFRAIQLGGAAPMARVPWNDTVWTQRVLDAGAMGLVVPMVNSVADAEKAVGNFKYGPKGQRSFGGSRIGSYIEGDYRFWADDQLACIVMIETVEAVEHAEEILAVEGVDGCFIGPTDLALSMGLRMDQIGPGTEHEAAMMHVLEAGKKVGTAVGKHCFSAEEVNQRIAQGFQFLACASDAGFMNKEASRQFKIIDLTGATAGDAGAKGKLY